MRLIMSDKIKIFVNSETYCPHCSTVLEVDKQKWLSLSDNDKQEFISEQVYDATEWNYYTAKDDNQ